MGLNAPLHHVIYFLNLFKINFDLNVDITCLLNSTKTHMLDQRKEDTHIFFFILNSSLRNLET